MNQTTNILLLFAFACVLSAIALALTKKREVRNILVISKGGKGKLVLDNVWVIVHPLWKSASKYGSVQIDGSISFLDPISQIHKWRSLPLTFVHSEKESAAEIQALRINGNVHKYTITFNLDKTASTLTLGIERGARVRGKKRT